LLLIVQRLLCLLNWLLLRLLILFLGILLLRIGRGLFLWVLPLEPLIVEHVLQLLLVYLLGRGLRGLIYRLLGILPLWVPLCGKLFLRISLLRILLLRWILSFRVLLLGIVLPALIVSRILGLGLSHNLAYGLNDWFSLRHLVRMEDVEGFVHLPCGSYTTSLDRSQHQFFLLFLPAPDHEEKDHSRYDKQYNDTDHDPCHRELAFLPVSVIIHHLVIVIHNCIRRDEE
jgi:hypothetical protein